MTLHKVTFYSLLPYNGSSSFVVDDGTSIPIKQLGHLKVSTTSRPLQLTNVCHVLDLSQNLLFLDNKLLFVTRLCWDNDSIVVLDELYVYAKDKNEGSSSSGFY